MTDWDEDHYLNIPSDIHTRIWLDVNHCEFCGNQNRMDFLYINTHGRVKYTHGTQECCTFAQYMGERHSMTKGRVISLLQFINDEYSDIVQHIITSDQLSVYFTRENAVSIIQRNMKLWYMRPDANGSVPYIRSKIRLGELPLSDDS